MLDRVLRAVFRHFTTLVLLAGVVTLPLNTVYAFAFRSVIATEPLHEEIAVFPPEREVKGVGAADLEKARWAGWAVLLIEAGLLVALVGAVDRVLLSDKGGKMPEVLGALRSAAAPMEPPTEAGDEEASAGDVGAGVMVAGTAIAVIVAGLVVAAGEVAVGVLAAQDAWAGRALVVATAHGLAAPFVQVPLALMRRRAKARRGFQPKL